MKKVVTKLISATLATAMLAGLMTGCSVAKSSSKKLENSGKQEIFKNAEQRVIDVDCDLAGEGRTNLAEFGLDMIRATYAGKNEMVSPMSILIALSMAANGAEGVTKDEFESMFGMSVKDMNAYLYLLSEVLGASESQFNSANAVWVNSDQKVEFNKDYIQTIADYYESSLYYDSFSGDACNNINKFVDTNTRGMIPKIIDELTSNQTLVLINAMAFEAEWDNKFKTENVRNEHFYNLDGSDSMVSMMYGDTDQYLVFENGEGFIKDYEGGEFKFVALLPDEDVDFEEFINNLSGEDFVNIVTNAEYTGVDISIPKFKCEYETELSSVLSEMGIPSAFDDSADFSNLLVDYQLNIDKVIHKTFIEVDTEGTKAAASTAITMHNGVTMMESRPQVYLDRPFVYAIVDAQYMTPVFMGMITEL